MFFKCYNLKEIDLSSFNTSNVKNMSYMFYYCKNLKEINLSSFNTSNVENMSYMFDRCFNLKKLIIKKEFKNDFEKIVDDKNILIEFYQKLYKI